MDYEKLFDEVITKPGVQKNIQKAAYAVTYYDRSWELADVQQEIYLAIWKSIKRYGFESDRTSYGVTYNTCLDLIDKARRRNSNEKAHDIFEYDNTIRWGVCNDFIRVVECSEELDRILQTHCKTILQRKIMEYLRTGYTPGTIGLLLNCPEQTVRVVLRKIRESVEVSYEQNTTAA